MTASADRSDSSSSLLALLHDTARGSFPPGDFTTTHLPSPSSPTDAVLMFFAHHLIASDVSSSFVRSWTDENPFALSDVRFLSALANELGTEPGIYDAVYAAIGLGLSPSDAGVVETDDHSHSRVARAKRYRDHSTIRVFTDEARSGVMVMGRGLAGRMEAAYEVDESARGRGVGRAFLRAARLIAPPDEPLFVQISPGNVWSMRALAHDHQHWRSIGAEVLFLRNA